MIARLFLRVVLTAYKYSLIPAALVVWSFRRCGRMLG